MGFRNAGGEREGYGVMRGHDGTVYTGQWSGSRRDGHGTLFFDGGVFEGQWSRGSAHGDGIVHFKNGDTFRGTYVDNQKSGRGVYRWADGAEEVGAYAGGRKHGWHRWRHSDEQWDLLYARGAVSAARRAAGGALASGASHDVHVPLTAAPAAAAAAVASSSSSHRPGDLSGTASASASPRGTPPEGGVSPRAALFNFGPREEQPPVPQPEAPRHGPFQPAPRSASAGAGGSSKSPRWTNAAKPRQSGGDVGGVAWRR